MKTPHVAKFPSGRAFSLVEVTVTLGILSFCILAIFALLPTGLNIVQESSKEAAAMNLLTTLRSDLQNISAGATNSVMYDIPTEPDAAAPSGTFYLDRHGKSVPAAGADFRAYWKQNPANANTGAPFSTLLRISWPPQAADPQGFVETIVVPERQTF